MAETMLKILEKNTDGNPMAIEYWGQTIKVGDIIFRERQQESYESRFCLVEFFVETRYKNNLLEVTVQTGDPLHGIAAGGWLILQEDDSPEKNQFQVLSLSQSVAILNNFDRIIGKVRDELRHRTELKDMLRF